MRLTVKEAMLLPKLSRLGGNEQAAIESSLFILKISVLIRHLVLLKTQRLNLKTGIIATLNLKRIMYNTWNATKGSLCGTSFHIFRIV